MKILIGYDGSETADRAIADLGKAGLPAKASAFILSVAPPLLPVEILGSDPSGSALYSSAYAESAGMGSDLEMKAKADCAKAARSLSKLMPGWTTKSGTCVDAPAHGLLSRAESWKPDMIVLGSHGWGVFAKLLLGSVSEQVLHHARMNVRIARKGARKHSGPPRLLIGFDGSPHAEAAIAEVCRRSWPMGTRVHILAVSTVQVRIEEVRQNIKKALHRDDSEAGPWPWIERALDKAAAKLRKHGLIVTPMITIADPRHALVEEAKDMGADCIFVGSRGLSGPKRFLVGSVSTAVAAHAPCSVEVIHASVKKGLK